MGVPVPFVSGDQWLVEQVKSVNPHITTVAVKQGVGESTVNSYLALAVDRICTEAEQALKGDLKKCMVALPEKFLVEILFKEHHKAKHASFYPGVVAVNPFTTALECQDYFDVLRFFFINLIFQELKTETPGSHSRAIYFRPSRSH